jgi:DEAD/DEAH box helicase domain-containing protein
MNRLEDETKLSLREWLSRLERNRRFQENVAASRHWPATPGRYASFPEWMHSGLRAVLEKRGISQIYSHQAEAVECIRSDRDVVLVTPTASGKTLCYNLPVLQKILENPETRALYIFPTKALAQDQMTKSPVSSGLKADIKTFNMTATPPTTPQAFRKQGLGW